MNLLVSGLQRPRSLSIKILRLDIHDSFDEQQCLRKRSADVFKAMDESLAKNLHLGGQI